MGYILAFLLAAGLVGLLYEHLRDQVATGNDEQDDLP